MATNPHRQRSWSDLPFEILKLFTDRLSTVDDIDSFGAVCRSWRSTAVQVRLVRRPLKAPFLILSSDPDDWDLLSLLDGRSHQSLHVPSGTTCVGSSEGWLIMINQSSMEMYLLNPITGLGIPLPPPPHSVVVVKAILSSAPNPGCNVAAIFNRNRLGWCTPGSESWSLFRLRHVKEMADIAFHQGTLYVTDGRIMETLKIVNWRWAGSRVPELLPLPEFATGIDCHHLVPCGGDLLLVREQREPAVHPSGCGSSSANHKVLTAVKVWRRVVDESKWVLLEDLEDRALFLSADIAAAAVEAQGSNLTYGANCVYFTETRVNPSMDGSAETQLLRYCYRDQIIQRCRSSISELSIHQPVWFLLGA